MSSDAIRKGKQLIKTGDLWALDIPADIKSRRALDYPIASELGERIDVYLDRFRSGAAVLQSLTVT